ncbi:GMC family oxidoreductase [Anderseniella sp. Alg231-50]|uniref:GMC family oxidoreductase n=1 Tax=Anderseniella sp. Alg231-50 TaxID=1922226 RepID=UPI00307BDBF6
MADETGRSPLPRSTDVLVVGAGAGGAAAAWALARKGVQVVLIDAGPEFSADEYKVSDTDWELQGLPHKPGSRGQHEVITGQPLLERWSGMRNIFPPRQRHSTRSRRASHGYSHVRGIGGSTLHFIGWMHRFRPEAFEMYSRFGVAADWPVSYAELEPYYLLAEQMVGVAGPSTVAGRPRSAPFPTPAHKLSLLSQTIAGGGAKIGCEFVPNTVAAPSKPYRGRPDCNYCGCCLWGCPRGDKGSADLTFVQPALSTGNCSIFPSHTLLEFSRGKNDKLTGATIVDNTGTRHQISASHYVLAGGAIETPRLLLAMDGLANESGQVGRNFMETVFGAVTGLHPEQIGSHRGYPEDSICLDFNAPDAIDGIPGGTVILPTVASSRYIGPARYAERLVEGFGTDFKRRLLDTMGKAVGLVAVCENLPNPRSFISLSDGSADENSMPIARINSFMPELEVERLAFAMAKTEEILLASGVPKILDRFTSYEKFSTTHAMGTCRMGIDPDKSVVNASQRSHRWKNLWISDASVFASSGGGDAPSLTIHALSIRMADAMTRQINQTG